MRNFLRKMGLSNRFGKFREVHSGQGFKILKLKKKLTLNSVKDEVSSFTDKEITEIIKGNKSVLKKHTTYYKSGNFFIGLVPAQDEKELQMQFIDEKDFFFEKGAKFLSPLARC